MNKSLRTFSLIKKIDLAKAINGMVYFIRKTPLLGKFLGDKYRFYEFKQIVYMFYPLFALIWQVIKSALAFGVAIIFMINYNKFALKILGSNEIIINNMAGLTFNEYTASLIVPSFLYIVIGLFRNMIVDNGNSIHELFTNFSMDARDIFKAYLYYEPILRFVGRSLVFAIAFYFLAGLSPIYSLAMSLAILFIELASSVFWMNRSLRYERSILDSAWVHLFAIIIFPLCLYLGDIYLAIPASYLSLGVLVLSIVAFCFSLAFMKNFNSYGAVIEKASRKYELSMDTIKDAQENQIKIKEKDLGQEKVKGEGFKKLNRLFFLRHKRLIKKPILIKTGILVAVGLVIVALLSKYGYSGKDSLNKIAAFIIPLIMYMLLRQDNIIRSMYLNCDQGLMPYGFYRDKKNILAMYKERSISLFKIMIIPSLILIAIYLLVASFDKTIGLNQKILTIIYIILLDLFFVNLPLMEYYLFQPFNREGQKTGKAVMLIDGLVYASVFFILPQITRKVSYGVFLMIMSIFILSFIVLSQVLIYKYAPRTFKIRN